MATNGSQDVHHRKSAVNQAYELNNLNSHNHGDHPSMCVGEIRLTTRGAMEGANPDEHSPNEPIDTDMEEILQELPSRQIENIADQASKSLRRRPGASFHAVRGMNSQALENYIIEATQMDLDDVDALPEDELDFRTLPTSLSRKRTLKKKLSSKRRQKNIGRCTYLKYWFGMVWQHFRRQLAGATQLFDLWRSHLMTIEGHFGTSVASYFIFLKWVLIINIPLFLLTFAFLVIPQILFRFYQMDPPGYSGTSKEFTGIELLTGAGFFENTEMYYGFYTNETVDIIADTPYKMKYAYLFTCGGYYLFCLILLGYSYLHSYRKFYIEASGAMSIYYFGLVLCGWDYGITSIETSKLKNKSLYNEFKEYLAGRKSGVITAVGKGSRHKWGIRFCTWFAVLCLLGGSGYATYVVSTELSLTTALANKTSIPVVSPLAMPVVISSIHLVVPVLFTLLEGFEYYSKPKYELYTHMFREMALKACILAVLVYFWFAIAADKLKCWETFVGEEIYRLVIIDFIFTIFYSFFAEFIRKVLSTRISSITRSEFAIGRHTLELIYSQTLCWLGVFYSPLIPFVVICKLIFIFYVKRYSVVNNCSPSLKPWRASRTHTIFVGYLFAFFILSSVAVGCSIILIKPSKTCGPYKNLENTYDVVQSLVAHWKEEHETVNLFFNIITSPGVLAAILIFFCVVLYYMRTVMGSHKSRVELLKMQLSSEIRDKRFLMNLLNQVKQRGRRISKQKGPALTRKIEDQTTSGKVFVRTIAEGMISSPQQL